MHNSDLDDFNIFVGELYEHELLTLRAIIREELEDETDASALSASFSCLSEEFLPFIVNGDQ